MIIALNTLKKDLNTDKRMLRYAPIPVRAIFTMKLIEKIYLTNYFYIAVHKCVRLLHLLNFCFVLILLIVLNVMKIEY